MDWSCDSPSSSHVEAMSIVEMTKSMCSQDVHIRSHPAPHPASLFTFTDNVIVIEHEAGHFSPVLTVNIRSIGVEKLDNIHLANSGPHQRLECPLLSHQST